MNRQTAIQVFSLLAIVAGLAVSYFPPPTNSAAIWSLVSVFLGYGVRDLFGPIGGTVEAPTINTVITATAPPVNRQAGRASLIHLVALAAIAALLCGCAGFQQAVSGYQAAAAKGLRAVEDNNIEVWTFNVCSTPFSAAMRHPEIIAAMRALCLPNGAAGSPAALLDAAQVAPK